METENIKAWVEGGKQWAAEVIALGEMPKSPMTTYHKRDLTQSIVLTNSLIHSKQLLETETGILGRVGGKGKEREGSLSGEHVFLPPARPLGLLLPKHSE